MPPRSSVARGGLPLAVLSSAAFGMSGTLAAGLFAGGWSSAAAVTWRVAIAALVLAGPAAWSVRRRWRLLLDNAALIVAYGALVVAFCQFAYFSAVQHLAVALALLIEYTAPVAVVGWMWLRHGQRPSRLTVLGAIVAAGGLVLVLDVFGTDRVDLAGVLWALAAMVGAAAYFLLNAHGGEDLPPMALAGGGLVVGAVGLGVLDLAGVLSWQMSTSPARYQHHEVAWWVPVLLLGLVTCALAYVTGIAATRRLGSRLMSFTALLEVLFALAFAWLALGQVPGGIQVVGGVLILAGVVVVRLGEDAVTARDDAEVPVLT